jgi:hypothetical protein
MPEETKTTFVHVFLGILPLLLSLGQVSRAIRGKSIEVHRWTGRLCLASALLSSFPALKLSLTLHDNGFWERLMVFILALAWLLSIILTYYYAAVNRNIVKHSEWGIRFTVYTHTIPLVGRVIAIFLWFYKGKPMWTLEPEP